MKTICRDCVLATWGPNGIQSGCRLDRIETFRKQDRLVLREDTEDNDYYTIDGFCNACRNSNWVKAKDIKGDPINDIIKDIRVTVDIVIYISEKDSYIDFLKTFDSVEKQNMLPKNLIIVLNNSLIYEKVVGDVRKFPKKWHVICVGDTGKQTGWNRCLDLATEKSNAFYYSVFRAGTIIPANFIVNIDHIINNKLQRFVLLKPKNINGRIAGLTVTKKAKEIFRDLSRFLNKSIEDVIENFGIESNSKEFIWDVETVCQIQ